MARTCLRRTCLGRSLTGVALVAACLSQASSRGAHAESIEEFYKSHALSIVIGFPPASAYDLYGRAVGRHIGKHIPGNPTVVRRPRRPKVT